MPERLSVGECRQLFTWASRQNFTLEEVRYAVGRVRGWSDTSPRAPLRRNWVKVIQNGMLSGWARAGFRSSLERQAAASGRINARTGQAIVPRTQLTPEVIERELVRQARALDTETPGP
jgi:hypothetical protein